MENVNYNYEGGFLAFIQDEGYTAYRSSDNLPLIKGSAVMSSIVPRGMTSYFIHDSELHLVDKFNNKEIDSEEFKKTIIYGLSDYRKPPALIEPRPKGCEDRSTLDRVMSRVLFKDILKAMFDKKIILEV